MSIPGGWALHFDWGCGGSYSTSSMTFNANGTFALAPYTGKWTSHDGQIIFRFDQAPNSIYSGAVVDSAMVGISTNFSLNGCWYAVKTTATSTALAENKKATHDAAGVAK
jgi:hypothetical protein